MPVDHADEPIAPDLPDPAFLCATVGRPRGLADPTHDWRHLDDRSHGEFLLREHPLAEAGFATLIAYMQRRFGPPYIGADPGNDVCGGWLLSTPEPAVFLLVRPSMSGASFSLLPRVAAGSVPAGDPERDAWRGRVEAAFRAAALDLLRPLAVRDSAFNALGEVPPKHPLRAYDDDAEGADGMGHPYFARPHRATGHPLPHGLVGSERFDRLIGLAHAAGNGDMGRGLDLAILRLEEKVLQRAAAAPRGARILLHALAALRDNMVEAARLELPARLRLDADDLARSGRLVAFLTEGKPADDLDFADADHAEAEAIGGALGFSGDLSGPLGRLAAKRLLDREWDRFMELVGGVVPDEAIPLVRGLIAYPRGADIPAFFINLRRHGMPGAADWGEAHLADPETAWIAHKSATHVILDKARRQREMKEAEKAAGAQPEATGTPAP